MKIVTEVEQLADSYVCHGGKANRRKQRGRMVSFAKHCADMGEFHLAQVGNRHVIAYWKDNRNLSDVTLYHHFLAIRELWQLSGKKGEPAKPFTKDTHADECLPQ
jgi:hypothetical protein